MALARPMRLAAGGGTAGLRPALLGAASGWRPPVTTLQSRKFHGPEHDIPAWRRFKTIPIVKRFRTWYGYDEPLWDLGNYPTLPNVHTNELPDYGWQDNFDKRNLNTMMHDEFDLFSDWSFDTYAPDKNVHLEKWYYPLMVVGTGVTFLVGLFKVISYMLEHYPETYMMRRAAISKEYPYGNLYMERGGDLRYKDGYFPCGPPQKDNLMDLPVV